jgi:hypothetical protein
LIFEHAASMGLRLVKLIEEPDDSGMNLDRPGLDELREVLASGDVDGVMVHDVGRLAREQEDFWTLYRSMFADGSRRLIGVVDRIDTACHPLWVRQMLDAFASLGLEESATEDVSPEGCVPQMVRRMAFLGVDHEELYCPYDDSTEEAVILHLDNQGGRPDDLVSIGISLGEASELRQKLGDLLDEGNCDDQCENE